jgi:predicted PurR-regulated permease PerM
VTFPDDTDWTRYAPVWLRRVGVTSWLILGAVILAATLMAAYGTLGGTLVPMVAALVFAVLFLPVVNILTGWKIPRTAAALIAMLLILCTVALLGVIVVGGFVQRVPEIADQLAAGWAGIRDWLISQELDPEWIDWARSRFSEALPSLGMGLAGWLGTTITSIVGLVVGLYFAIYVLFFLLRDSAVFVAWATRNSQIQPELAGEIVSDAAHSIRGYFRGTAISAALTAIIVAIPLVILDVPVVVPILVLYFFTSFIPYLGAFIGGAFAVIIAFGSGGADTALIVLIAVIISNGGIQTALNSWALGTSLRLHPLAVLLATTVGGAIAGVMGMILGAPILALAVHTTQRIREHREDAESTRPVEA